VRSALRRTSANTAVGSPSRSSAPAAFIATDTLLSASATRSAGIAARAESTTSIVSLCAIVHKPRAGARRTGSLVSFSASIRIGTAARGS
jgi:hypothetical protein